MRLLPISREVTSREKLSEEMVKSLFSFEFMESIEAAASEQQLIEKAGILVLLLFQGSHHSLYTFVGQVKLDTANQKFSIMKAVGGKTILAEKVSKNQRALWRQLIKI